MKQTANILLDKHLKELGLEFEHEWRITEKRRWRADYAITNRMKNGQMILLEIEGGIWSRGRHTRGKGYQADLNKYNCAAMAGYSVLRFSTEDVMRGRARAFLKEHLKGAA